jgi:hypothetical protein
MVEDLAEYGKSTEREVSAVYWISPLQTYRLVRIFHELLSRDRDDGRATGQPQGFGFVAYMNGTSQGRTPEDARKDDHIRGRSK